MHTDRRPSRPPHRLLALGALALALCPSAQAGRPMAVDDANTDDKGTGHVEAWYARLPGRVNAWTVAPVYSPIDGLELGASVTRDRTTPLRSQALQARWRITPAQESGCNVLATLGAGHTQGVGRTPFVNGVMTCNSTWGATHFNLGANRAPGGPTLETWGIAHAREFGAITAHAELFGQRLSKPTFQVGARTDVAPGVQLDGSIGRWSRQTVYSVGMKYNY